jgi:predicted ester cyclase
VKRTKLMVIIPKAFFMTAVVAILIFSMIHISYQQAEFPFDEETIDALQEAEEEEQEAKNIKTVNQLREALNTGDVSRVHEFISPEYFNHESQVDPVRSKLRGPEEFIDTVKNLRNAFADLHYEEQETIASGDKVIQILTITGKHVGNFFGIAAPTGNNISYQGVHIYRIGEDGKIVEHKAIRDDLKSMMQLGIVSPASPEYEQLFQAWKGFKQ